MDPIGQLRPLGTPPLRHCYLLEIVWFSNLFSGGDMNPHDKQVGVSEAQGEPFDYPYGVGLLALQYS